MLVFAHRGYSAYYPENTMLAFQKAYELGVDGIELDVQMTKDGHLVIAHDETCLRCMGDARWLKDLTLEEIRQLNAAQNFRFDEKFLLETLGSQEKVKQFLQNESFQYVPTLEEYFSWAKGKDIWTNVELKTGIFTYQGIEEKVVALIEKYDLASQILLSSFNHGTVMRVKALLPQLKCGLLTESWLLQPGDYCKKAGVEAYHPLFVSLEKSSVENLKKEKIEINVYTVNEEEHLRLILPFAVNTVMSNFPERMKKVLKEKGLLSEKLSKGL